MTKKKIYFKFFSIKILTIQLIFPIDDVSKTKL